MRFVILCIFWSKLSHTKTAGLHPQKKYLCMIIIYHVRNILLWNNGVIGQIITCLVKVFVCTDLTVTNQKG